MATEADTKNTPLTTDTVVEKKRKRRKNKIYRYPSNIGSDEQPHAINFYIFKTESLTEKNERVSDLKGLANAGDRSAAKELSIEEGRQSFLRTTAAATFGIGLSAATSGGAVKKAGVAGAASLGASELIKKAGAMQSRITKKIDTLIK